MRKVQKNKKLFILRSHPPNLSLHKHFWSQPFQMKDTHPVCPFLWDKHQCLGCKITCTFGRGLTNTKLETDLKQLRFVMFSELTVTVLFFTACSPRQAPEIFSFKQKTMNRVMRPQADAEGRKHPPVPGQSGRVSPKWSLVCLRALLLPGQWGPEGPFLLLVNAWILIQVRITAPCFVILILCSLGRANQSPVVLVLLSLGHVLQRPWQRLGMDLQDVWPPPQR